MKFLRKSYIKLIRFKKLIGKFLHIIFLNPVKKIKRKFLYFTIKVNPNIYRPSYDPYISGDSLRKFSDHVFDETKTINLKKIKKGDILFLKTDLLDIFFNNYHNQINQKYILITHNSDKEINKKEFSYLDDKIIHWFTQNLCIESTDKISPLPIGLENKRYMNNPNYSILKRKKFQKTKNVKIMCAINPETNQEREDMLKIFKEHKKINNNLFKNHKEYITNLSKHHFNICPPGNGSDTHRFWETLLLGTIPIVVSNTHTENFKSLGIPALYLKNWNQLNMLDEEYLKSFYLDTVSNNSLDKYSNSKFWYDKINSKRVNL